MCLLVGVCHVGLPRRLSVCRSADVESEQIDFIDSCVGEEEEEEGRSRGRGAGGGDGTSLSSQFMAYIERRITREVQAPPLGDDDITLCVLSS